ncbi:hypothetical protein ACQP2P_30160 [Dactylosporangium sp. CA-139114]|uniref:hypothetical protein n=1 Tax=Dactylosporangium sp. CA-139114 TaxID=3239931 RepID=UPI003D980D3F
MTLRSIRRRCRTIVRGLSVPEPFNLDAFLAVLAEQRGRPMHLLALDLPVGAPCGLCIATDTTDYIAVTKIATGPQRDHIALHEVAHLLLGHRLQLGGDDEVPALFRHIDPRIIERVFARTTYSTLAEQEAEVLASLLGQRISQVRRTPPVPDDPIVGRLGRSLEHGRERHD